MSAVSTTDDHLRANLGVAIAYCCDWAQNRQEFGRRGAITPLVNYMTSRDPNVHRATALALYHLSFYSINCVTMHAVSGNYSCYSVFTYGSVSYISIHDH